QCRRWRLRHAGIARRTGPRRPCDVRVWRLRPAPSRPGSGASMRRRQSSIAPMTQTPGEAARFLLRNAVDALPEGVLERQLSKERPLRVKLGIDPTAPDIHLGHTVVLRKLREFQDLGHTVVLIVGDYTGRVGDPSGRSQIRPQLDPAEIDRNAETFQQQALTVLDRDRTEVRRNSEWLDMEMEALFRLARKLTARFHGDHAAAAAEAHFDRLHVEHGTPDEVDEFAISGDTVHLPAILSDAFGLSRSEGRRLIDQGGVKLDGEPLANGEL